jgi:uncharacterized protein YneF (UPF0154 family)
MSRLDIACLLIPIAYVIGVVMGMWLERNAALRKGR